MDRRLLHRVVPDGVAAGNITGVAVTAEIDEGECRAGGIYPRIKSEGRLLRNVRRRGTSALALPALLPAPGSGRAAQAALPFCCLRKASARLANSCGATSSLWVAINQLLPDGSFTAPPRSP